MKIIDLYNHFVAKGDSQSLNRAARILQQIYKTGNTTLELLNVLKKHVSSTDIIDAPTSMLITLKDMSRFEDVLKDVAALGDKAFTSDKKMNEKAYNHFNEWAIQEDLLKEGEKLEYTFENPIKEEAKPE